MAKLKPGEQISAVILRWVVSVWGGGMGYVGAGVGVWGGGMGYVGAGVGVCVCVHGITEHNLAGGHRPFSDHFRKFPTNLLYAWQF